MKVMMDCPYCGQLMDVSEDTMKSEENLNRGWHLVDVFGSKDICRCPHCNGRFIREIEYDLVLDRVTVEKEKE